MSDQFADFEVEFEQSLDGVKEWGGETGPLLDPGTYQLLVVEITSDTGAKGLYASVKFEVVGQYTDEGLVDGQWKGAFAWNNYSFSKKALGRVKQLMLACGAQLDKFRAGEIMGQTIVADVIHNVGQAKIDDAGNPMEPKTFANVANERSISAAEAQATEAAPEPPPVTNKAPAAKATTAPATNNKAPVQAAKPATGAPRRA